MNESNQTSKPVLRWTCGNVSPEGFYCLRKSIIGVRKVYGDLFDLVICTQTHHLQGIAMELGVSLVHQRDHVDSLPILPTGPAWKLYPPRLRLASHEIIMDNDVVLHGRHRLIDEFLSRDDLWVATQAYRRSYGKYDDLVPDGIEINTGIVCMPPNYDLGTELRCRLRGPWGGHFDEQGVFASVVASRPHALIPLDDVWVAHPDEPLRIGSHGVHFIGLNGGFTAHWKSYITGKLL